MLLSHYGFMSIDTLRYEDSFRSGQEVFEHRIDDADNSGLVVAHVGDVQLAIGQEQAGFYRLQVSGALLRTDASPYLGRVLLYQTRSDFRPAILSALPHGQDFELTVLEQPYDPKVGFTRGMHFALSAKAQTRVQSFGAHGARGGFEAGHFSTVLVAASAGGTAIAEELRRNGDAQTHKVLEAGTPETMAAMDMLPLKYKSVTIQGEDHRLLPLVWHRSLETAAGAAAGDYPGAVRLMMGAGLAAIGQRGIDSARRLVDDAIRGAH